MRNAAELSVAWRQAPLRESGLALIHFVLMGLEYPASATSVALPDRADPYAHTCFLTRETGRRALCAVRLGRGDFHVPSELRSRQSSLRLDFSRIATGILASIRNRQNDAHDEGNSDEGGKHPPSDSCAQIRNVGWKALGITRRANLQAPSDDTNYRDDQHDSGEERPHEPIMPSSRYSCAHASSTTAINCTPSEVCPMTLKGTPRMAMEMIRTCGRDSSSSFRSSSAESESMPRALMMCCVAIKGMSEGTAL